MYCTKCGAPNEGNSQFCGKCGNPLQSVNARVQNAREAEPVQPSDAVKPQKKRNMILTALIVLLALAAVIIVWVTVSPDKQSGGEAIAANTSDDAQKLVRIVTDNPELVYDHDENIIQNDDGTYRLDVNTPDLAETACFVVGPVRDESVSYSVMDFYYVIKGTKTVMTADDNGNLSVFTSPAD